MLNMKLKERVFLTLFLSICILFILKFKPQKDTDSIGFEIVEDSKNLFDLEGGHLHKKRETDFNGNKGTENVQNKNPFNDIKSDSENNEPRIRKIGETVEKERKNQNKMDPWDIWWTMVDKRHVTKPGQDSKFEEILQALGSRKILSAKVGAKGTQLKAFLQLDGPSKQKVVFKPKRYPRNHVINGKIYDGFDRHNGEIAAFHLDRILGFHRAPPVVGRQVNMEKEFKPVAEERLLKTFFKNDKGDECFYGVCYYCKKTEPACAEADIMEGSVTIWLPTGWDLGRARHPWQRTYNKKKARWELDQSYCQDVMSVQPYNSGPRLLDIMDTSIFDFLIGNGDRHHYETFKKGGPLGMLLHLDNGKSFGNPEEDELSILAPIMQCCRLRKSTYERLKIIPTEDDLPDNLASRMRKSLLKDPISPVMPEPHLQALNRRLKTAMNIIKNCININQIENVIIDDGF